MDRRSLLGSILLTVAAQQRGWPLWISAARADDSNWRHGVSLFDDLKYPAGFEHFEYVNQDSPKGGTAQQIALGTFDNFNSVIAGVKGSLAAGIDLIYETLLVSSLDEVSSGYGLLAEAVSFPSDFSSATYRLREQAKWHDGTPVTPDDVIFSFEAFKRYSPQLSAYYRHITKANKTGDREVTFTVDAPGDRELPLIIGELTVLPTASASRPQYERLMRRNTRTGCAPGILTSSQLLGPHRSHPATNYVAIGVRKLPKSPAHTT